MYSVYYSFIMTSKDTKLVYDYIKASNQKFIKI